MNKHVLAIALVGLLTTTLGAAPVPPRSTWTTLGTMSGPIASPTRSQPSNLLRVGDQTILIDAGDGAAEQLAKAGVSLEAVHTLILTHLHFDHTGGLFAILGMRFQTGIPGILTIYGPPGTRQLIDGLIAAMQPMVELQAARSGRPPRTPGNDVKVIEIADGETFSVGTVTVTAAANTHYGFAVGSADAAKFLSFAYRFVVPDRTIAFTGDTGPSPNVERLAQNADLLVSEIIDPDEALADLQRQRPNMPPPVLALFAQSFRTEHLPPDQVGLLAQRSGAKALVLTHNGMDAAGITRARAVIATHYSGKVSFANDLENF